MKSLIILGAVIAAVVLATKFSKAEPAPSPVTAKPKRKVDETPAPDAPQPQNPAWGGTNPLMYSPFYGDSYPPYGYGYPYGGPIVIYGGGFGGGGHHHH